MEAGEEHCTRWKSNEGRAEVNEMKKVKELRVSTMWKTVSVRIDKRQITRGDVCVAAVCSRRTTLKHRLHTPRLQAGGRYALQADACPDRPTSYNLDTRCHPCEGAVTRWQVKPHQAPHHLATKTMVRRSLAYFS